MGKPGSQLLLLGCCKRGKAELPWASAPRLRLLGRGGSAGPPCCCCLQGEFGVRTTCSLTDGISSRHCCQWGTAVTSSSTRLRSSRPASATSCARCCPGTRWVPRPGGVARTPQCRADPRTLHGLRCACANEVHARPLLTPRVELAVQGDAGAQGPRGCSPHSEQASLGQVTRPVSSSVSPCAGEWLLWPGAITRLCCKRPGRAPPRQQGGRPSSEASSRHSHR